ncbi:hypothetical protein XPA_003433 [Xanthoria parietina]
MESDTEKAALSSQFPFCLKYSQSPTICIVANPCGSPLVTTPNDRESVPSRQTLVVPQASESFPFPGGHRSQVIRRCPSFAIVPNDDGIGEFARGHQVAFDQGCQVSVFSVQAYKSRKSKGPTLKVDFCHGEPIGGWVGG